MRFADIVTTWTDADCVETNKVDGIDRDGKLIYRRRCKNFRKKTRRTAVKPIVLPSSQAAALRVGDLVTARVDPVSRRGALVRAVRRGTIVAARDVRLAVPEPALEH